MLKIFIISNKNVLTLMTLIVHTEKRVKKHPTWFFLFLFLFFLVNTHLTKCFFYV